MNGPSTGADFEPAGFFILRTPLLPFDEFLAWGEGAAGDRRRLRARLHAFAARPEVRQALFIASPALEDRLDVERNAADGASAEKMDRALVRYLTRMTGRPTPFGLFAGCSVGRIAEATHLELAARSSYQCHTRLDMDYQQLLADALGRLPDVRIKLVYRPNSTLYRVPGRWRYIESRRQGEVCTHHLISLEDSTYLQAVLDRARAGASCSELGDALLAFDPDASRDEADEYVAELIDTQVLVSDLHPTITGGDSLAELVGQLQDRDAARPQRDVLETVRSDLAGLDADGLPVPPARYRAIADRLRELPAGVNLAELFQVDLIKPAARTTLGGAELREIERGARIVQRLAGRPRAHNQHLKRFREAFVARYEEQEVPLVEALDAEVGVGFGGQSVEAAPLLDGIALAGPSEPGLPGRTQDAYLMRLVLEAAADRRQEIILSPEDIDQLAEPDAAPLPDSFAVVAEIAAPANGSQDDFLIVLVGAHGPPGARLMGRFCYADDVLHRHVSDYLRAEEALQPDSVFAELVHAPEQKRVGNILFRPVLRGYEIAFLGRSGAPLDEQLPLSDLLVSVVGSEIRLRSARLGRRVIPRLTAAHDFRIHGHAFYRFLGALQEQGRPVSLTWSWGVLQALPFLPRVVTGRLVLARARWRLEKVQLNALVAGGFEAIQAQRERRHWPRFIELVEGENLLPIDLDNLLSVETMLHLVQGRDEIELVEMIPPPERLSATGPEGRYVHELLVPFTRKAEAPRSPVVHASDRAVSTRERCFPPGSEWLYAKLYAGALGVEELLREVVPSLVNRLKVSGAIDSWFFVRYGDPDWHLRLRFHGNPERIQEEVLLAVQQAVAPFLNDRRVWRLQLDTYEREVERYGGLEGILRAERLFHADSEALLTILAALSEDTQGDRRFCYALYGSHRLLTDLGLDLAGRIAVVCRLRENFGKELRADDRVRWQLGDRYRKERKTLTALLEGTDSSPQSQRLLAALAARTVQWGPDVEELGRLARAGQLTQPLSELAQSYVHMHLNRLLRSNHRAQELVLYDFLLRYYQSQAARDPAPRAWRQGRAEQAPDL